MSFFPRFLAVWSAVCLAVVAALFFAVRALRSGAVTRRVSFALSGPDTTWSVRSGPLVVYGDHYDDKQCHRVNCYSHRRLFSDRVGERVPALSRADRARFGDELPAAAGRDRAHAGRRAGSVARPGSFARHRAAAVRRLAGVLDGAYSFAVDVHCSILAVHRGSGAESVPDLDAIRVRVPDPGAGRVRVPAGRPADSGRLSA